jgi:cytochrome P450
LPRPIGYPVVGLLPEVWQGRSNFSPACHSTDNSRNYAREYSLIKSLLGEGLLTSNGKTWLRQRRLMHPAFHLNKIAGQALSLAAAPTSSVRPPPAATRRPRPGLLMTLQRRWRGLAGVLSAL